METRATEENIMKYLEALKKLHTILSHTNRLSMLSFSEKNKLTKSLSTVLSKGGVIKCTKKGINSEWEWTSIPPNRHMAIKTLQSLAEINPPRKVVNTLEKKHGGNRKGAGRKTKAEELKKARVKSYEVRLLWGMAKFKINPIYI